MKRFDINWVRVVASIAKLKARKVTTKKMRSSKFSNVLKLNGGEISCKT